MTAITKGLTDTRLEFTMDIERKCESPVYPYLLLTEVEVRTVSYGPGFSPSIYGPGAVRGP